MGGVTTAENLTYSKKKKVVDVSSISQYELLIAVWGMYGQMKGDHEEMVSRNGRYHWPCAQNIRLH